MTERKDRLSGLRVPILLIRAELPSGAHFMGSGATDQHHLTPQGDLLHFGTLPIRTSVVGLPLPVTRSSTGPATFSFNLDRPLELDFATDPMANGANPTNGLTLLAFLNFLDGPYGSNAVVDVTSDTMDVIMSTRATQSVECAVHDDGQTSLAVMPAIVGEWHSYACVATSNGAAAYRDGVLIDSLTAANPWPYSVLTAIGMGDDTEAVPVQVASVYIYARELTSTELASADTQMVADSGVMLSGLTMSKL